MSRAGAFYTDGTFPERWGKDSYLLVMGEGEECRRVVEPELLMIRGFPKSAFNMY
jgi:hypothetical protein